jgi:Zn-dependent alcohol dehydrogenase
MKAKAAVLFGVNKRMKIREVEVEAPRAGQDGSQICIARKAKALWEGQDAE